MKKARNYDHLKDEMGKIRTQVLELVLERLGLAVGGNDGGKLNRQIAKIAGVTAKGIEGIRYLNARVSNLSPNAAGKIHEKLRNELGYKSQEIEEVFLDLLTAEGWELLDSFLAAKEKVASRRKDFVEEHFFDNQSMLEELKLKEDDARKIVSCESLTANLSVCGLSSVQIRQMRILTYHGLKDAMAMKGGRQ